MKLRRRLSRPILTLVIIQLVWMVVIFYWIHWFLGRNRDFRALAETYKPDLLTGTSEWLIFTQGIVLLVLILVGVYAMFLYWRWQSKLYQRQQSYISQITHELKSPLASIRLHLETMRLRDLPPDRLEQFLETMLSDTDRLHNLINNLLLTAKLESRRPAGNPPYIDFSSYLFRFFEDARKILPPGSILTTDIEEGVFAGIYPDEMEMVLRNLLENAVLYSSESPEITISLRKAGKQCRLTFSDKGKGLDAKDLKRVFQMFYRVRHQGESIRGTGLGLYIVKTVLEDHGGKISVTSGGPGTGCTFSITLPAGLGEVKK